MTTAAERPLQPVDDEPETDSSTLSVLGQLKAKRENVVSNNHIDMPVPRWDSPVIVVRYGPLDHNEFKRAGRQVDRAADNKKAEVEVNVNCDLLARAVQGVYGIVGGQKYSLRPGDHNGDWTKFDDDLAKNLGCGNTAREIIKSLYITEGDILSTAGKLAEFSGYKEQEADDSIAGE